MIIQPTLTTDGMPSPNIGPYSLKTYACPLKDSIKKTTTLAISNGFTWLIVNEQCLVF